MSFERSEAVVTYERGAVTIEQMSQAVARYGFTAALKTPTACRKCVDQLGRGEVELAAHSAVAHIVGPSCL